MDRHRAVVALEVQDALDPQQVFPARGDQHFQPKRQAGPVERLVQRDTEGADPGVMAVRVVVMVMVVGVLERRGIQPAGDIRDFWTRG